MTQDKHTALPWVLEADGKGTILKNQEKRIISTYSMDWCGMDEANANAAFIVRAVNNHYQLIEALEKIAMGTAWFSPDEMVEFAEQALSNAKGVANDSMEK